MKYDEAMVIIDFAAVLYKLGIGDLKTSIAYDWTRFFFSSSYGKHHRHGVSSIDDGP